MIESNISRRSMLKMMGMSGLGIMSKPLLSFFDEQAMIKREIPSSGEQLPVVGLGTWIQFDVGASKSERSQLKEVLKQMGRLGGKVIDSSPMYGRAENVIGELTTELEMKRHFFYATKVWTRGRQSGINQMQASMRKMQVETIDLMQVHNLVDWETHLKTLHDWKAEGKIRYTGITHYTDASHSRLEEIIRNEDVDFVQFNYSIRDRHAEQSLLQTAKDHGVATVINSPYGGGSLFRLIEGKPLPEWASEYDINSWGQFFLKYILGHPAVTCVIPGTSDPVHVVDNMKAGYGRLPDTMTRKKMVRYLEQL